MANSQFRSKRQVSGKRYVTVRKTRASDLGRVPALTSLGEKKLKVKRVKGGNLKKSLLRAQMVQVFNGKKTVSLKVTGVEENPANINFTRRNIITKGAGSVKD